MKNVFVIVLVFVFQLQLFSQNNEAKWLVIINGFSSYNQAIDAQNNYDFSTEILNSAEYENLNPGWYIITLQYDNKDDAINKSKELNLNGEKSYVKYSGYKKVEDNSITGNVKFIIDNKYVVLGNTNGKTLNYDDKTHFLDLSYGTPVDLYSSAEIDELAPGIIPWTKDTIYIVGKTSRIIKKTTIKKIYILSRIQIETYRPPWCWEATDYYDCMSNKIPEDFISKYVWNYSNSLIVGEIEETNEAVLAIKDISFKPSIYYTIPLNYKIKQKKLFKDFSDGADAINAYACNNDTICTFIYPFEDEICGSEFTNYTMSAWKLVNDKPICVPYLGDYIDLKIDMIIRFNNKNKSCVFKQNKNTGILLDLDGEEDIILPFEFEDPWEC